MRIFKNVLISILIGHLVGALSCAVGAIFALKMPDGDGAAAIFGMVSCAMGSLAMAIASKRLCGGSVVCALLCGVGFLILSFGFGRLSFGAGNFGVYEIVNVVLCILPSLLLCFSGVTFMGRKRRTRKACKKIFK